MLFNNSLQHFVNIRWVSLNCLVILSCTGAWSQEHQHVKSPKPEDALPSNAIVHAKIKNPLDLFFQAETFTKDTLPDAFIPSPFRVLMEQEHPLLSVLGMFNNGEALDTEELENQTGLDLRGDITLSIYPGDPSKFFILSLGLSDARTFMSLASQAEGPLQAETVSIGGYDMLKAEVKMGPLKRCFGLTSNGRLYISGEPSLLLLLRDKEGYSRLSEDPHMSDVIQKAKDLDIFISVHPGLAKPLLGQIGLFKYLPISLLSQQKEALLKQISADERKAIDAQIKMQLPFSGMEELLNYAECVVTAAYQTTFESIASATESFEGFTLGIRGKSLTPGLTFMLHAGPHDPHKMARPIPLKELESALERFPAQANQWSAQGQTPNKIPSIWITQTLEKLRHLLEARDLRTTWLDQLQKTHNDQVILQPMESQSDWTLKVAAKVKDMPHPRNYDSLRTFFTDWTKEQYQPAYRQVFIAPDSGPDLFAQHLIQQKFVLENSRKQAFERLEPYQRQGWIDQIYRVNTQKKEGDVSELTWENAWLTKSGLFGFNQHELIHRKVYLARKIDNHLVYHQDSGSQEWLENFEWQSGSRMPGSARALLNIVPEGSHSISFIKLNDTLPTAIHALSSMEALAHRDMHAYLQKAQSAIENIDQTDETAIKNTLASIPFSPLLAAVNQDPASGKVYGLLPGNIAFPRPRVAPLLEDIIEDYEAIAKDVGGIMTYVKQHDNTSEFGILHHTGGVSSFIKKIGNTLAENYVKNPEGIQTLMSRAMTPLDMNPDKRKQTLLKNPQWLFMENIKEGMNEAPGHSGHKTAAGPRKPIPIRADHTPDQCIPLDAYYNAALDDNFHLGGLEGNDLASFPKGTVNLAGVTFDVRGLIHLTGQQIETLSSIDYPQKVTNIIIGRKAEHLHFLHGAGWPSDEGQTIAKWTIYYDDGTENVIRVHYGKDVADWWTAPDAPSLSGSQAAWEGENAATRESSMQLRLFKKAWNNPHPEKVIKAIDYTSSMKDSSPFMLAITAD